MSVITTFRDPYALDLKDEYTATYNNFVKYNLP